MFLAGDVGIFKTSPDYFIEKFWSFFGFIDFNKKEITEPLLNINIKEYEKTWSSNDYRIHMIVGFLMDIYFKSKDNNIKLVWKRGKNHTSGPECIKCPPSYYFNAFNDWFGDVNKIKDEEYTHIHELVYRDVIDVYMDTIEVVYPEFFLKLNRIQKLNRINENIR